MNSFGLIPLTLLLGLLVGIDWFIYAKFQEKHWFGRITNPTTIFGVLIGWILLGFIFNLDYTQNWGCIISSEYIFTIENMLYSGIAVLLLSIGFFIPLRTLGITILICELLFWLYKLFLVKGGYVVGFGGVPSTSVLVYDTIALVLRLVLILKVSQLRFKTIFLLLIALITISIKIIFFR